MKQVGLTFCALVFAGTLAAEYAVATCKKGIAISSKDSEGAERIAEFDVAWYYNWDALPTEGATGVEFVPMVWGPGAKFDEKIRILAQDGPDPVVLAFNEPDHGHRYKMTVEEAIDHWDELDAVSNHLSSPAPARVMSPWFQEFMDEAEQRSLDVDFVAVHWYGPPRPERLLNWLQKVHARYQKPIWITEFAVADWTTNNGTPNRFTPEEIADFMEIVLPELDKLSFVRRYAWFGAISVNDAVSSSHLFNDDDTLTPPGQVYAMHTDQSVTDCALP